MNITISDIAAELVKTTMAEIETEDPHLFIYVAGGGSLPVYDSKLAVSASNAVNLVIAEPLAVDNWSNLLFWVVFVVSFEPVYEFNELNIPITCDEPLTIPDGIEEILAYVIWDEPETTPLFALIGPVMLPVTVNAPGIDTVEPSSVIWESTMCSRPVPFVNLLFVK